MKIMYTFAPQNLSYMKLKCVIVAVIVADAAHLLFTHGF